MINLLDLVNKYIDDGFNEIYANAKVAQDIVLKYLFKSQYRNHVTLKGGVVMFNLTNDKRRATVDIDLDLIRIYLADDNLYKIFTSHKLKGIDIYVNSKEQIFVEKIIPILKFGVLSTRYKDFFDLYWLIKNTDLNKEEILKIMNDKIFCFGINGIYKLEDLVNLIDKILSNENYLKKLQEKKNNWIEVENIELKSTILNYLKSMILIEA